jgi:hypothetical protein
VGGMAVGGVVAVGGRVAVGGVVAVGAGWVVAVGAEAVNAPPPQPETNSKTMIIRICKYLKLRMTPSIHKSKSGLEIKKTNLQRLSL